MSLSDSMFLFEIIVEEVTSLDKFGEYCLLGKFADVFELKLKNPNELENTTPTVPKKTSKHKTKVREGKSKNVKTPIKNKIKIGQSILVAHNSKSLVATMERYPLELSLCSKISNRVFGFTQIPWNTAHINYLKNLKRKLNLAPVTVDGIHNIFDEKSSRRIAMIKLSIKVCCLNDKFTTQYRAISEENKRFLDTTPNKIVSTIKDKKKDDSVEPGIIKTIYTRDKQHLISTSKTGKMKAKKDNFCAEETIKDNDCHIIHKGIVHTVKSEADIKRTLVLEKSRSIASLEHNCQYNTLNYIFGDNSRQFGNRVYYVGYCTVQNDNSGDRTPSKESSRGKSLNELDVTDEKLKLDLCECSDEKGPKCYQSQYSLSLPADTADFVKFTKCEKFTCDAKGQRQPPPPKDDRLLINLESMQKDCCNVTETIEEVVGGLTAKMKIGKDHPCYCSCECTFGFTKKTTYCKVCGGYEAPGEDLPKKPGKDMPFPCPIYHKLVDRNRLKSYSSGSDSKKSLKSGGKKAADKSGESEKDKKKGKIKKDDRFKFNYGYQGIPPQIGHSQCAMPCTGTLGAVPKNMGWLWTAEDIPGMKFRPLWRPGATNKHVVRLLRIAKNPDEVLGKKRRKDGSKKKPLKRPLLVVHKKDGEYTVTMETMKQFSKPRAVNQNPFEDKPVVTYTIGRSEEENRERRKRKERAQRRLEREQRDFIQSAFKDMCKEICIKTYQQALGILPDTEDPDCACYTVGPDKTNMDVSCSCSQDSVSIGSDTDSDEWIVEFTPPNAYFDPTYKSKKVIKVDNGSQYTYLDYRVKLSDRFGNPVPRFFKGPDGKQQCSDLGGFWSPDHQWLEINVDGYIAPDNRWAPNNFIGPNGEQMDCDTGKFQAANGNWLVVGVDGYIDPQGRWRFYPKRRSPPQPKKTQKSSSKKGEKIPIITQPSVTSWSCFGDASPRELSKKGIVGHGLDRKLLLTTLQQMLQRGEDVTIPQPSVVPRRPESKKGKKARFPRSDLSESRSFYDERTICRHPVPSDKGIVAVDEHGNKTYFKLKSHRNRRPKERLQNLHQQGISLSSFHVPCFHSFINSEIMKEQQRERLLQLSKGKSVATET